MSGSFSSRRALQTVNTLSAPSVIFGTGKDRGNLWQVRADYTLNSRWKGHALYESLNPGDFYAGTDGGYFLRFEVVYTTKLNF